MLMFVYLLVYVTRRTANCVALGILIGTYQLVNDVPAEVMPVSIFNIQKCQN